MAARARKRVAAASPVDRALGRGGADFRTMPSATRPPLPSSAQQRVVVRTRRHQRADVALRDAGVTVLTTLTPEQLAADRADELITASWDALSKILRGRQQ